MTCACGCGRAARKLYCKGHNGSGATLRPLVRRIYIGGEQCCAIALPSGQETIISKVDLPRVGLFNWRINRSGYVVRNSGRGTIFLHRAILGDIGTLVGDHINRNRLDNRRSNLRPATQSQNHYNTTLRRDSSSGRKGISFDARRGTWKVHICYDNGKQKWARAATREQAVAIREKWERIHHGEFSAQRP